MNETPLPRVQPRKARRPEPFVIAACVVLALGGGALVLTRLPSKPPRPARAARAVVSRAATGAVVVETIETPTPLFATYRSLPLRLPVRPQDVTRIAYHQASGKNVFPITSLLPEAGAPRGALATVTPATDAAEVYGAEQDDPAVLRGDVLRLWRSGRRGFPDTAADVGADAGTPVYSPVSGKVLAVHPYKLYDRWPDVEVHIQPDGWPEVDVVLIHITGVRVRAGERVDAGTTRIAAVRLLSNRVHHQLAGYTDNGGDHVHVQLNRMRVPGRIERIGGS
ncbi:MAG: hypothetical protein WC971_07120 [Coriobacteriia bacterium]